MKTHYHFLIRITVAGMLVALCGCTSMFEKGSVRFSAAAVNPGAQTRVKYGDDFKDDDSKKDYVRLDWVNGDQILITSNYAATDDDAHSATYTVTNIDSQKVETTLGRYSYGSLFPAGKELLWNENYRKDQHEFWSIHPVTGGTLDKSGQFTATIPSETTISNQNSYLWMVAHVPTGTIENEAGKTISLYFFPVFTDVRLELNHDTSITEQVTLQSCELSSTAGTLLSGSFSAMIATEGQNESNGITSYLPDSGSTTAATICNNLPIYSEGKNPEKVDILCLPFNLKDGENIILTCNFTIGTMSYSKYLTISGSKFHPRRQHRLKGLILPGENGDADIDITFIVETMGQEIGGTIGSSDWSNNW